MIQNRFDFSKLTKVVINEAKLWSNGGVKETDSKAVPMLTKYWSNVGQSKFTASNFNSTTWQNSWPWSAAYVSWVITQVDGSFPKSTAHREYAKKGFKNRNDGAGGWSLYSLSREKKKIKAQVGDVLFKPRGKGKKKGTADEERKYGATHSDVVWKVTGGVAYLSGGNLGQTNKTNIKISLNSDGSYPEKAGGYHVILKKM